MFSLIRAEFTRLFRYKGFYIFLIISLIFGGILGSIMNDTFRECDYLLLIVPAYLAFIASPFISLYVCRDFHDGTIRNKIISGHSRASIFFAEFTVCFSASIIMQLLFWTYIFVNAKLNNGVLVMSTVLIAKMMLCCILILGIYTALLVTAAMLIGSRASAVIWTFIAVIILTLGGSMISGKVQVDDYERIKRDMGMANVSEEDIMSDTERQVYVFFDDVLPMNQSWQLIDYTSVITTYVYYNYGSEYNEFFKEEKRVYTKKLKEKSRNFLFIDTALIAVIAAFGVFSFRRKLLK